jgi:O-antigen/teichoic acid export membrane protein
MSFIKKSVSTFATSLGLMVVGMATGVISARVLGPEIKGQAALLSTITEFLFMGGGLGLGSAFSFYIAKKQYPSRQILTCALFSSLILGCIVIGVFYITMPLHSKVWEGIPTPFLFYAALLSVVSIYSNYLLRVVVGYGRIYEMNIAGITNSLTNFASVVVFLLVLNLGLTGMMGTFWLSAIAQLAVLLFFLRNDLPLSRFWSGTLIKDSFAYGVKSHALLLINFLNYRVDILLLKNFTDATSVGYYSLAVSMAELMWMFPNSAVAPLFSGVAASEATDRSLITLRTVRWSLIFLFILAICGIFFGKLFIRLLYGNAYLPSYMPFLWLLPGICLFPIFKLLVVDLAARGNPGFGTIASLVALVVNIVANIILIPRMGASGAALATSFSYICMSILSIFFFLKVTKYRFRDIFVIGSEEVSFIKTTLSRFISR